MQILRNFSHSGTLSRRREISTTPAPAYARALVNPQAGRRQGDCIWSTTGDERLCSPDGARSRVIRGHGTSGGARPRITRKRAPSGLRGPHMRSPWGRRRIFECVIPARRAPATSGLVREAGLHGQGDAGGERGQQRRQHGLERVGDGDLRNPDTPPQLPFWFSVRAELSSDTFQPPATPRI